MTAPRIHLVIGFAADRSPKVLHLSTSAGDAAAAFAAASEKPGKHVAVQFYKFPAVTRRKIFGEFTSPGTPAKEPSDAKELPAELLAKLDDDKLAAVAGTYKIPVPVPFKRDALIAAILAAAPQ